MRITPSAFFPFLVVLLIASSGCGKKVGGLLTLKKLSDQQALMAEEIRVADERFEKLVLAIHEGRLSEDNSKRSIRRLYGEPVLSEQQSIDGDNFEVWLYRYAKQFFGANKVYLYFDNAGRLKRWQYVENEREAGHVQSFK